MNRCVVELQKSLSCEILHDHISRVLYSNDASIYEIEPLAVVIPRNTDDIVQTIKIASKHNIPITARGAATGITGGAIGSGIIIDTSRHLTKILEINPHEHYAIVQPGVVQDVLNNALKDLGLRLGPDTSTGNRATLGGMIANNSAGAHSLYFGSMIDHIEEIEVVLANGSIVRFKEEELNSSQDISTTETAHIQQAIVNILEEYKLDIQTHFPLLDRVSSGYRIDKLIRNGKINIARLFAGSEGTLGFITELKVRLSQKPKHTILVLVAMSDLINGVDEIQQFLALHPYSLEMIDKKIIEAATLHPSLKETTRWLKSIPEVLYTIEFCSESSAECENLAMQAMENAKSLKHQVWSKIIDDPNDAASVWEVRKQGLGMLLSKRSYSRAVAFIEDIIIPPQALSQFLTSFNEILQRHHKEAGIYGHVGVGCLHIRPYIDTRSARELDTMQNIMTEVMTLVHSYRGAMSSEHGDGIVRAHTIHSMFGDRLYEAFCHIKDLFDSEGIMNPGKKLPEQHFLQNLRLNTKTKHRTFPTHFTYQKEGGFELTVDLCNGNGQCRKLEGVMCPSFQATQNEKDTTRARANALRAIIHGKISYEEAYSKDFYDVFDLCLQCKGCKTECPSQVDIAKVKSDYLDFYHSYHGRPLSSYIFGYTGNVFRAASLFPFLSNAIMQTQLFRWIQSFLGISSQRTLPKVAFRRFSTLKKTRPSRLSSKKVALFIDTFTEFCQPKIGIKAIDVLESMGFEVLTIDWTCCGRTLFSKGLLPEAKAYAKRLIKTLYPIAQSCDAIIGLEPSCILTIKDEYTDGFYPQDELQPIIDKVQTIDEFLLQHSNALLPLLRATKDKVHIHTHCHQKAIVGSKHLITLLRSIPGITATEIPTGCCGMAGSFGYEKEHYEISKKIASLKLLPYLSSLKRDEIIIANGFSCSSQIQDFAQLKSVHIIEYIHSLMVTK